MIYYYYMRTFQKNVRKIRTNAVLRRRFTSNLRDIFRKRGNEKKTGRKQRILIFFSLSYLKV